MLWRGPRASRAAPTDSRSGDRGDKVPEERGEMMNDDRSESALLRGVASRLPPASVFSVDRVNDDRGAGTVPCCDAM